MSNGWFLKLAPGLTVKKVLTGVERCRKNLGKWQIVKLTGILNS